jgi:hypothetical protein
MHPSTVDRLIVRMLAARECDLSLLIVSGAVLGAVDYKAKVFEYRMLNFRARFPILG